VVKVETKMTSTIVDFLVHIRIFDSLDPGELKIVARHMNYVTVQPGETVFRENKMGNYVCFVADGLLEVYKTSEVGHKILLTTLKTGNSIGEMSILDNQPRSATVTAKTAATLVTLSSHAFDEILDNNTRIGLKILIGITRLLSQNLRLTSALLADHMLPMT
jgi:CRP/FNR family transcriptional regulator, cyclic AMP receptor protein